MHARSFRPFVLYPATANAHLICKEDALPRPYGLKSQPRQPYMLDIAVLKQTDGNFCVCKIINFKEKAKISDILPMTFVKPVMVDWKNNVKYMKKYLHYVFENLGRGMEHRL